MHQCAGLFKGVDPWRICPDRFYIWMYENFGDGSPERADAAGEHGLYMFKSMVIYSAWHHHVHGCVCEHIDKHYILAHQAIKIFRINEDTHSDDSQQWVGMTQRRSMMLKRSWSVHIL